MPFQYIAIEGPMGVGKTSLAERLATRIGRRHDPRGNGESVPRGLLRRPSGIGVAGTALLSAEQAPSATIDPTRRSFRQSTVSDYLFDKDKILRISISMTTSCYLSAPLRSADERRVGAGSGDLSSGAHRRSGSPTTTRRRGPMASHSTEQEYLRELNEAYQHFFFHYSATPLLVVETSQLDLPEATMPSTI